MPRLLTMFACFVWPRKGAFVAAFVWAILISVALDQSAQAGEKPVSFINEVVPVLDQGRLQCGRLPRQSRQRTKRLPTVAIWLRAERGLRPHRSRVRGRRLFLPAPERSLLLLKPSGQLPHGGGVRLDAASEGYAVLREWIRQGARYDAAVPRR